MSIRILLIVLLVFPCSNVFSKNSVEYPVNMASVRFNNGENIHFSIIDSFGIDSVNFIKKVNAWIDTIFTYKYRSHYNPVHMVTVGSRGVLGTIPDVRFTLDTLIKKPTVPELVAGLMVELEWLHNRNIVSLSLKMREQIKEALGNYSEGAQYWTLQEEVTTFRSIYIKDSIIISIDSIIWHEEVTLPPEELIIPSPIDHPFADNVKSTQMFSVCKSSMGIKFSLPGAHETCTRINIINTKGLIIRSFENSDKSTGYISWELRNNTGTFVPTGIYYITFFGDDFTVTKSFVKF